jgi:hypothetical protein
MLITSHRPITPEIRYPMTPSAGNPKRRGPIPVVMIMEEPMIMAEILDSG